MQRISLAQGLITKVRNDSSILLRYESDYTKADVAIRDHLAEGALLEVSEDGAYDIGYCLMLCEWLRQVLPHCRLMLMCSERKLEDVHRAIEAKQKGEIDDFVFYDASLDYLVACLQSL